MGSEITSQGLYHSQHGAGDHNAVAAAAALKQANQQQQANHHTHHPHHHHPFVHQSHHHHHPASVSAHHARDLIAATVAALNANQQPEVASSSLIADR